MAQADAGTSTPGDAVAAPGFFVRNPWLVVTIVLVLWVLVGWVPFLLGWKSDFGDVFGAVNALFSGLAFAMIILTISLQKQELVLQRRELELTREELKGQKEQLEIQNVTLARQMTENTFFALLRLHHEVVGRTRLGPPWASDGATGLECFEIFRRELFGAIPHSPNSPKGERYQTIKSGWTTFYGGFQAYMGHYLENLYELLRFVDSRLVDEQKFFGGLLRAQLSSTEIILLFYMTVNDKDGGRRFYPLIKKFRILEHNIPMGRLASPQDVEIHSDLLHE